MVIRAIRTKGGARNVALGIVAILCAACGGNVIADDGDGGTRAGTSSDGGTTAPSKAGSADDGFDGGLIGPTPGKVRCGNVDCDAKTELCCLSGTGDPATNGCAPRGQTTCNGSQARRACDEQADCNLGEVCCAENVESPPVTIGTYCFDAKLNGAPPGCGKGEVAACSSDADCNAIGAPACAVQTCRGNVLQTCGLLPSGWCD